jgi:predicted RND superfamily exporter protein
MIITGTLTAVVYSMAKSYLVAFVVITPLMILLIGNLRIGLLSMVPNLTPILVALGLMGWFGHPVDVFTMLVGSIAMGLAVDDTIHFMHNFRRYFARSGDVDRMLTGFTIVLAFLGDVVLAPALMALAMRRPAVRASAMETST